jgi:trk/ktr system potassium uptake protein
MKVVICGAGQVGFHIAQYLASQENDITVIDQSAELVQKIRTSLDVQAMVGHGSDPDVLAQANTKTADMLIAVTSSDEVNMVACQVAASLFEVPIKIARIRNRSYLQTKWAGLFGAEKLPIDFVISPEIEIAEAVYRRLEIPGAFEMIPFAGGKVAMVGLRLEENCPVVDTPLKQLSELFPDLHITVMAIVHDKKMFVPAAEDHMEVGDSIYFTAERNHVARAMTVFGHEEKEARHIVIVGGGNVGLFLAQLLEERAPKLSVKIIEHNEERAGYIATQLGKTLVIHGDALDNEILKEASIDKAETVIAVSNDDEVNILSSLLAKRLGCSRAITLINKPVYGPLIASLGIDVFLDPKETTVSKILQHIRKGKIRALHTVRYGEAEVLEAEVLETSPLLGKSLKELKLPKGIVAGAVARGDTVLMPRGDTRFQINDRVVLLALANIIKKVEKLFAVRVEFF